MKDEKTLILSVDRDNDFGTKSGVITPVIGLEGCVDAATALAITDPEDSDVNCLFAAIKLYKDLRTEGKNAEIALICGDSKVGHKSDSIIIEQLEEVLEITNPQKVMLVGDGAEDEFINPIIASRVPIDYVKKVYVKQAPGIESTLYVLAKMINDPDKKRRFLVPIGGILLILGSFFVLEGLVLFYISGNGSYILDQTWSFVLLILGLYLALQGYGLIDKWVGNIEYSIKNIRSGNLAITFAILTVALLITGILLGIYTATKTQIKDPIYIIVKFGASALWPIIFAVMFWDVGKLVNNFIKMKKINRSFMVGTITVIGLGFVFQGILDIFSTILGYGAVNSMMILLEVIIGVALTVAAAILQSNFTRYYNSRTGET